MILGFWSLDFDFVETLTEINDQSQNSKTKPTSVKPSSSRSTLKHHGDCRHKFCLLDGLGDVRLITRLERTLAILPVA